MAYRKKPCYIREKKSHSMSFAEVPSTAETWHTDLRWQVLCQLNAKTPSHWVLIYICRIATVQIKS